MDSRNAGMERSAGDGGVPASFRLLLTRQGGAEFCCRPRLPVSIFCGTIRNSNFQTINF